MPNCTGYFFINIFPCKSANMHACLQIMWNFVISQVGENVFSSYNNHSQPFLLTVLQIQGTTGYMHYQEKFPATASRKRSWFQTQKMFRCHWSMQQWFHSIPPRSDGPGMGPTTTTPKLISLNFKIVCHLAELYSVLKFAEMCMDAANL